MEILLKQVLNVEELDPQTVKAQPQTRLSRLIPMAKERIKGKCWHCSEFPIIYKGYLCDRCSFYAIHNFDDLEYAV